MARINLLDKAVYNQISAGEVVENPASIVKELVENSIDAGADKVSISIENGGIKSITVTDNGCGMEKDDLYLSILPHATSKIKYSSDLDTIGTLGFRGEALSSISAVSEVVIKSRYADSAIGNYIEVKGGEVKGEGICPMAVGTVISINSLFYNTPARYKFLKQPKGEEKNVTSLVAELIFANPTVAFTYKSDEEVVYKTNGNGLEECIYAVLGEDIFNSMLELSFEENGYKISGYTARPASEGIRNNRTKQTIIVNGRVVSDQTISAVVQNAYGEYLMKRTFPAFVLDIVMPFDMVDVNVHPNKREVRFADEKKINGIIYHTVKNTIEKDEEDRQQVIFSEFHSVEYNPVPIPVEKFDRVVKSEEKDGYLPGGEAPVTHIIDKNPPKVYEKIDLRNVDARYITFSDSGVSTANDDKQAVEEKIDLNISYDGLNFKIIGQVFDTYLLVELNEKIIFIDQHATHERILFDKLVEETESGITSQDMLLPFVYSIDDGEADFLRENIGGFKKLGFNVDIYDDEISVSSVPLILNNLNIEAFLLEVLAKRTEIKSITDSSLLKDKLAKIACKNAIKGGDTLNEQQVKKVLRYFFKNGVPMQCPHGRPTMIKISKEELEKYFGRKV